MENDVSFFLRSHLPKYVTSDTSDCIRTRRFRQSVFLIQWNIFRRIGCPRYSHSLVSHNIASNIILILTGAGMYQKFADMIDVLFLTSEVPKEKSCLIIVPSWSTTFFNYFHPPPWFHNQSTSCGTVPCSAEKKTYWLQYDQISKDVVNIPTKKNTRGRRSHFVGERKQVVLSKKLLNVSCMGFDIHVGWWCLVPFLTYLVTFCCHVTIIEEAQHHLAQKYISL